MKRAYDKKEDIPKGFENEYEESGGKFVLKAIEGLKPIEDFLVIQSELSTAKQEKAEIEKKFKPFEKLDPKEVQQKLDKYEIYEKKKSTKTEDEVSAETMQIKIAELQRENDRLTGEHKTATETLSVLHKEKINGILKDKIRELTYNKDKQQFSVHEASLPVIEKILAIDMEYNETAKNFFTKDEKKVPLAEYLNTKSKEYGWGKGSTGDGDTGSGNGNIRKPNTESGTTVDAINDAINRHKSN